MMKSLRDFLKYTPIKKAAMLQIRTLIGYKKSSYAANKNFNRL